MNQIEIKYENDELVVSSLDIATNFKREHKTILRAIDNLAAKNCTAKSMFYETTHENRGKQYPMYLMNRDGFSLLVMGFTGSEALDWKLKYIQAFNDMEKELNSPERIIARGLIESKKLIENLNNKINEMKPKVDFYNAVADSKTAIPMDQVAKILDIKGIGRNKLFEFLRNEKILMQNNQPYQKYVDKGYFRVVETKYTKPNGDTEINIKTLVYQTGIDFIRRILKKEVME